MDSYLSQAGLTVPSEIPSDGGQRRQQGNFCSCRGRRMSTHRSDFTIFNKSSTATASTSFDSGNVSLPACTTVRDLSFRSCNAERIEGVNAGATVRFLFSARHRYFMVTKTLVCLQTLTYACHSHSIISWRLNSLADKGSFGRHLYRTVRRYEKNPRLVAIEGE